MPVKRRLGPGKELRVDTDWSSRSRRHGRDRRWRDRHQRFGRQGARSEKPGEVGGQGSAGHQGSSAPDTDEAQHVTTICDHIFPL
jgi:hypothetical protein